MSKVEKKQTRSEIVEIETVYEWDAGEMSRKKGGIRKTRSGCFSISTRISDDKKRHTIICHDIETETTSGIKRRHAAAWIVKEAMEKRFEIFYGADREIDIFDGKADPEEVIAFFGHLADILCERNTGPLATSEKDADEAWRRMKAGMERDKIDTPEVLPGKGGKKTGKPRV